VSVNGKSIDGSKDVQKTILAVHIGSKVDLTVWRDGQTVHLSPTTAELPGDMRMASHEGEGGNNERSNASKAKIGIGLSSVTPMLAERIGIDPKIKGAVITSVRDGSPAQEAGLQQGDVIVEVDRKPVATADDAAKTLGNDRAGGHLLRVRRGEAALFVVIPSA
jgi:serine protease Do